MTRKCSPPEPVYRATPVPPRVPVKKKVAPLTERQQQRHEDRARRELEASCELFYKQRCRRMVECHTNTGHIYLVTPDRPHPRNGAKPYKIGFSRKPKNRLADLQLAHYEPLVFKFLSKPLWDVKTTEDQLHHRLNSRRIRGEWFLLTRENITRIMETCEWERKLNTVVGKFYRVYGRRGAAHHAQRDYPRLMELIKEHNRLLQDSQSMIEYRSVCW